MKHRSWSEDYTAVHTSLVAALHVDVEQALGPAARMLARCLLLVVSIRLDGRWHGQHLRALESPDDSASQLPKIVGLVEVVVHAELECNDSIRGSSSRRVDEDRDVARP